MTNKGNIRARERQPQMVGYLREVGSRGIHPN